MDDTLLHVDHGEPLATPADALAVQYPQRLFGVVERVVDGAVAARQHILLPQPGVVRLLDAIPGITASRVMIVGVRPVAVYDYRDLSEFASRAVSYFAALPDVNHIAMPVYGSRGYRLDDDKAFEAQVRGIVGAVRDRRVKEVVGAVTLIERDAERAIRLGKRLVGVVNEAARALRAEETAGSAAASKTPTADTPVPPAAPGTLFLCYRRDDAPDAAGRLYDSLAGAFGPERVFMDIDSVPLGVNVVTHINQQLQGCAAVLVMIGRSWTASTDAGSNRRLDDPADHVRVEVATALKQNVPVIPVLVQNASMPRATDLPDDIRDLAFYNGIKLAPEFWRAGVERLIKELDRVMKK
jgi:hypothetical protein